MSASNDAPDTRSETIRSPALYFGEFQARERRPAKRTRRWSGSGFKAVAMPLLYRLFRTMPGFIALAPVNLLVLSLRPLYWWKSNPLRRSCEYLCRVAAGRGQSHRPATVYRQLLSNVAGAATNYFELHRKGAGAVLERIALSEADAEKVNVLVREHGGVVIVVPHNFCAAFAAVRMHRAFPLVLISRNSATIERTRIAIDFYERMGATVLMVRGGNPFELSRTMFSVLKSGKAIAATVDSIDNSAGRVDAEIFGQSVGFTAWAAKIAARLGVPVLPSYCRSSGQRVEVILGEPIISDDVGTIVQHYIGFFERQIIEDPASWSFLGDKRWIRVLHRACEEQEEAPPRT